MATLGRKCLARRRPATGNTARCSRDKGYAIPKKVCRGQRGHEEAAADKQGAPGGDQGQGPSCKIREQATTTIEIGVRAKSACTAKTKYLV